MSFSQPLRMKDLIEQGLVDATLLDEAAMQYSLVAIEIFGVLCAGPLVRGACAGDEAEIATLDSSLATLRAAETVLYDIADCGSIEALDAYRTAFAAIEPVGRLLSKHRLYAAAAVAPGTTRAFARFKHDAVGAVESAMRGLRMWSFGFGMSDYFETRRATDPAIAPLYR